MRIFCNLFKPYRDGHNVCKAFRVTPSQSKSVTGEDCDIKKVIDIPLIPAIPVAGIIARDNSEVTFGDNRICDLSRIVRSE